MNKDKVTELLKNYRAYVMAIRNYHRTTSDESEYNVYMSAAPCRVAIYSDMPKGSGGGAKAPKLTGDWGFGDTLYYNSLKEAVRYVEEAMWTLTVDERSVIELKWMDGVTLEMIAERKNYSVRNIKRIHRRALLKLETCLAFVEIPVAESGAFIA